MNKNDDCDNFPSSINDASAFTKKQNARKSFSAEVKVTKISALSDSNIIKNEDSFEGLPNSEYEKIPQFNTKQNLSQDENFKNCFSDGHDIRMNDVEVHDKLTNHNILKETPPTEENSSKRSLLREPDIIRLKPASPITEPNHSAKDFPIDEPDLITIDDSDEAKAKDSDLNKVTYSSDSEDDFELIVLDEDCDIDNLSHLKMSGETKSPPKKTSPLKNTGYKCENIQGTSNLVLLEGDALIQNLNLETSSKTDDNQTVFDKSHKKQDDSDSQTKQKLSYAQKYNFTLQNNPLLNDMLDTKKDDVCEKPGNSENEKQEHIEANKSPLIVNVTIEPGVQQTLDAEDKEVPMEMDFEKDPYTKIPVNTASRVESMEISDHNSITDTSTFNNLSTSDTICENTKSMISSYEATEDFSVVESEETSNLFVISNITSAANESDLINKEIPEIALDSNFEKPVDSSKISDNTLLASLLTYKPESCDLPPINISDMKDKLKENLSSNPEATNSDTVSVVSNTEFSTEPSTFSISDELKSMKPVYKILSKTTGNSVTPTSHPSFIDDEVSNTSCTLSSAPGDNQNSSSLMSITAENSMNNQDESMSSKDDSQSAVSETKELIASDTIAVLGCVPKYQKPFQHFYEDYKKKITTDNPIQCIKLANEKWKNMSPEERHPYNEKYLKQKHEHDETIGKLSKPSEPIVVQTISSPNVSNAISNKDLSGKTVSVMNESQTKTTKTVILDDQTGTFTDSKEICKISSESTAIVIQDQGGKTIVLDDQTRTLTDSIRNREICKISSESTVIQDQGGSSTPNSETNLLESEELGSMLECHLEEGTPTVEWTQKLQSWQKNRGQSPVAVHPLLNIEVIHKIPDGTTKLSFEEFFNIKVLPSASRKSYSFFGPPHGSELMLNLKAEKFLTDPVNWLIEKKLVNIDLKCKGCSSSSMQKIKTAVYNDGYAWCCSALKGPECKAAQPFVRPDFLKRYSSFSLHSLLAAIFHWAFQSDFRHVRDDTGLTLSELTNFYTTIQNACAEFTIAYDRRINKITKPYDVIEASMFLFGQYLILAMYDRVTKFVRLRIMPPDENSSKEIFHKAAESFIFPNHIIVSDCTLLEKLKVPCLSFSLANPNITNEKDPGWHCLNVIKFVRRHVQPLFKKYVALSSSANIWQGFLYELEWRQRHGLNSDMAFWSIMYCCLAKPEDNPMKTTPVRRQNQNPDKKAPKPISDAEKKNVIKSKTEATVSEKKTNDKEGQWVMSNDSVGNGKFLAKQLEENSAKKAASNVISSVMFQPDGVNTITVTSLLSIKTWPLVGTLLHLIQAIDNAPNFNIASWKDHLSKEGFFQQPLKWFTKKNSTLDAACKKCHQPLKSFEETEKGFVRCKNALCNSLQRLRRPKFFSKFNFTMKDMLLMIYHWAIQSSFDVICKDIKLTDCSVRYFFWGIQKYCCAIIHQWPKLTTVDASHVVEVGIIQCGDFCILGALNTHTKETRLKVMNAPMLYKSSIFEPTLDEWLLRGSTIVTCHSPFYMTNHKVIYSSDATPSRLNAKAINYYLKTIVNALFSQYNTTGMKTDIIQCFLDEILWRQIYGYTPEMAFNSLLSQFVSNSKKVEYDKILPQMGHVIPPNAAVNINKPNPAHQPPDQSESSEGIAYSIPDNPVRSLEPEVIITQPNWNSVPASYSSSPIPSYNPPMPGLNQNQTSPSLNTNPIPPTLNSIPPTLNINPGPSPLSMNSSSSTLNLNSGPPNLNINPGPSTLGRNPGVPSPSMNPGPPTLNMNPGPPTLNMNPGPPTLRINSGSPNVTINSGPPNVTINSGPPNVTINSGPPNVTINSGPPIGSINSGPSNNAQSSFTQAPPGYTHVPPLQQYNLPVFVYNTPPPSSLPFISSPIIRPGNIVPTVSASSTQTSKEAIIEKMPISETSRKSFPLSELKTNQKMKRKKKSLKKSKKKAKLSKDYSNETADASISYDEEEDEQVDVCGISEEEVCENRMKFDLEECFKIMQENEFRLIETKSTNLLSFDKPNAELYRPVIEDCFSLLQNPKKKKKTLISEIDYVPLDEYYFCEVQSQTEPTPETTVFQYRCPYSKCSDSSLHGNISAIDHALKHIEIFRENSRPKSYSCPFFIQRFISTPCCLWSFSSGEELDRHITDVHLSMNSLSCLICCIPFLSTLELNEHMKDFHVPCEMPYTCPACSYKSSVHREVLEHFQLIHKNDPHLICPYCLKMCSPTSKNEELLYTSSYSKHLFKHQDVTENVKCPACCLILFSYEELRGHILKNHRSYIRSKEAIPFRPRGNPSIILTKKIPEAAMLSVASTDGLFFNPKLAQYIRENAHLLQTRNTKTSQLPKLGMELESSSPERVENSGCNKLITAASSQVVPLLDQNNVIEESIKSQGIKYDIDGTLPCLECGHIIDSKHFFKELMCQCKYVTFCAKAFCVHIIRKHAAFEQIPKKAFVIKEAIFQEKLFCSCSGFSSEDPNKLADHLKSCGGFIKMNKAEYITYCPKTVPKILHQLDNNASLNTRQPPPAYAKMKDLSSLPPTISQPQPPTHVENVPVEFIDNSFAYNNEPIGSMPPSNTYAMSPNWQTVVPPYHPNVQPGPSRAPNPEQHGSFPNILPPRAYTEPGYSQVYSVPRQASPPVHVVASTHNNAVRAPASTTTTTLPQPHLPRQQLSFMAPAPGVGRLRTGFLSVRNGVTYIRPADERQVNNQPMYPGQFGPRQNANPSPYGIRPNILQCLLRDNSFAQAPRGVYRQVIPASALPVQQTQALTLNHLNKMVTNLRQEKHN